jgi:recombination protein RecT
MPESNFLALIDSRADEIKALIPKYLSPERFFVLAREVERNPQLRACTPQSLFDCVLKAAQCGLELGTVDQHCFVIPYGKEAQLQIGYRGMIFRLVQAGVVGHMYADVIRKNDTVEILSGTRRELVHRFAIGDRGDVIGAYSVATMPNGTTDFELMETKDLDAIEKAALRISGNKPSPAWSYFKTEMQKKSVIKRHAKRLQGDRRGLMKDDEAARLDLTFAPSPELGEKEEHPEIPPASDGTQAPTPRRVQPEMPPKEDRPLSTGEVDDLFDQWISLGGKRSALAPFLEKNFSVDDLVKLKLSQVEPLTTAMQSELAG